MGGGIGDWDIQSYRSFYESDEHWALKKEFMETHYHALPEDRLVCLAQVYANIELLGCRYPQQVMEEISYLARGIGLVYKERKKTKLQRTFVKASDAAGAKVRGQKRKNNGEGNNEPSLKKMVPFVKSKMSSNEPLSSKPMMFVKAGSMSETPSSNSVKPTMMTFVKAGSGPETPASNSVNPMDSPFEKSSSNQIMSFIKAVRDDKPDDDDDDMIPEDQGNESAGLDKCMSLIKSMRGESDQSSAKISVPDKVEKYKKAVQQNSRQKITFSNSEEPSNNSVGRGLGRGNIRSQRGRGSPASGAPKNRNYARYLDAIMRSNDPLAEFILVQRLYVNVTNPISILQDSSAFSNMPVEFSFDNSKRECFVYIKGMHIATGTGDNMKSSKNAAALETLEVLLKRCFTLRILKLHSSTDEVSLSEVSTDQNSTKHTAKHGRTLDTPVEDSSIGSKLLKMMGWGGGGLGKDGSGIAEPIRPVHVFGRTGLGHEGEQGVTKAFKSKIRAMLQDYRRGDDMEDMAFSPDFSKEQRAEIHKIARTMQLKSHSHGKGENRFLVISRRLSSRQLLKQILSEGPTDKFEVVPPGKT